MVLQMLFKEAEMYSEGKSNKTYKQFQYVTQTETKDAFQNLINSRGKKTANK